MHATCNWELTSPDTGTVSEAIAGFERLVGTELGVAVAGVTVSRLRKRNDVGRGVPEDGRDD